MQVVLCSLHVDRASVRINFAACASSAIDSFSVVLPFFIYATDSNETESVVGSKLFRNNLVQSPRLVITSR